MEGNRRYNGSSKNFRQTENTGRGRSSGAKSGYDSKGRSQLADSKYGGMPGQGRNDRSIDESSQSSSWQGNGSKSRGADNGAENGNRAGYGRNDRVADSKDQGVGSKGRVAGAAVKYGGKPGFGRNDRGTGVGYEGISRPGSQNRGPGTATGYRSRTSSGGGSHSYGVEAEIGGRKKLKDNKTGAQPGFGSVRDTGIKSKAGLAGKSADHNKVKGFKGRNTEAGTGTGNNYNDIGWDSTDEMDTGFINDKLEGRNSVLEAIKSGRSINKLLVAKGLREGSIRQLVAMAREQGIIIQEVDKAALDSISSTHAHQGVIAFVAVKDYVEVDDILKFAEDKKEPPFIVILDEITDPHNLGSILRTADAAGAHGIIIPERRAVGLSAAVSKASAGAVEYVPVARVPNISRTIDYLKKLNIWIAGTDSSGGKSYFEHDLSGPCALVIGSEGKGMGKLIRDKCDLIVNIPMKGRISSLNAAVAGGIVMYEISRQRGRLR